MKYTWEIEVGKWTVTGWDYIQTYDNGTDECKEKTDIWDLEDFQTWWTDTASNNPEELEELLNSREANEVDYKWIFTARDKEGEKIIGLEFWENELIKELIERYKTD